MPLTSIVTQQIFPLQIIDADLLFSSLFHMYATVSCMHKCVITLHIIYLGRVTCWNCSKLFCLTWIPQWSCEFRLLPHLNWDYNWIAISTQFSSRLWDPNCDAHAWDNKLHTYGIFPQAWFNFLSQYSLWKGVRPPS